MGTPIVRFAPSPTGYLHVGGVRTALYNWLYARNQGGKFILRIEDTDQVRSTQESVQMIIDGLKWLGLDWDEGPIFQSQNNSYLSIAEDLVQQGKAYYSEKDDQGRSAIIFHMPKEIIKFNDIVFGEVQVDMTLMNDLVLIKSDGFPAYNFACVVDDIQMHISHILRGEDHLSNTPKQIALYHALGHKLPKFAHLSMILGEDKQILSKRHGAVSVGEFRKEGIVPDALINYLALLGWSPGNDQEFMDRHTLIKNFSLKTIHKKSAVFDIQKLYWLNSEHLRKLPFEQFIFEAESYMLDHNEKWAFSTQALKLIHSRVKSFKELNNEYAYFSKDVIEYNPLDVEKYLNDPVSLSCLAKLYERYEQCDDHDFNVSNLEKILRTLAEENNLKAADLIHPLRVAVTGRSVSPSIFETLEAIGKAKCVTRLERVLKIHELA